MHGYGWRAPDDEPSDDEQTELPDEWKDPGAPPSIPGRRDDDVEVMVRKNGDDVYGVSFFDPTEESGDTFIDVDPSLMVELGP